MMQKINIQFCNKQMQHYKNKHALQQTYAALEKQANTLKSICKSYEQEKTLIELMKKQKIVLEQEKKELMDTRNDAKNKYTVLQQTNATLQKQANTLKSICKTCEQEKKGLRDAFTTQQLMIKS
eukprot:304330_1